MKSTTICFMLNSAIYGYNIETKKTLHVSTFHINVHIWAQLIEINKVVYIVGGVDRNMTKLKTLYSFRLAPTLGPILQKASLQYPITGCALADVQGKWIYVVGGFGPLNRAPEQCDYYDVCYKYTINEDKWIKVPSLNLARAGNSVCVFNGQSLYAYGGCNNTLHASCLEKLDLLHEEDGWQVINVPTAMKRSEVDCIFVPISSNEIIILGGGDADTLAEETWTYLPYTAEFVNKKCRKKLVSEQADLIYHGFIYYMQLSEMPGSNPIIKVNAIHIANDYLCTTLHSITINQ